MKHPLWIVNSSLLFLFLCGLFFIYFTQQEMPQQKSFVKKNIPSAAIKKIESINLSKIYENDLFDTIQQPLPELHNPEKIQEIPTPPGISAPIIPQETEPVPLPPLSITLKGVMIVNDNSNNVVMINDNATNKEKLYKVGDIIQDSQIVKIFNNKVVFIRSNGQQEILFLNEKDLLNDQVIKENNKEWTAIVSPLKENEYEIDLKNFISIVPDLPTLLNMFEITTVYKEGKQIGCRIGDIIDTSLGASIGLKTNDIITKIFEKPIATFEERLIAYDAIKNIKIGETCIIELLRNKKPVIIKYIITENENSVNKYKKNITSNVNLVEDKKGIIKEPSIEELEKERVAMLKEKYQFAPTVQEILLDQKNMMLHEGNEKRLEAFSFVNKA